jgi:hypothetical protein
MYRGQRRGKLRSMAQHIVIEHGGSAAGEGALGLERR